MRNIHLMIICIVCCCFIFSCTTYRYIYSASPASTPYFKEKGESKAAAYYSADGNNGGSNKYAGGFDVQGAYALSNHLAVTANYFFRREKDYYGAGYDSEFDTSVVHYKRGLLDAGAGYFFFLDRAKTISANIYAGIGGGKFSFTDNGLQNSVAYNRYHQSAVTKWYIQPSLNAFASRHFRFSLATKFSFVHYGNVQTTYTSDELTYFGLDKIANKTLYFFEPSLNVQFVIPDHPWIAIDVVFSATSGNNNENDTYSDSRLAVRGSNSSLGVSIDFSKLKKNR